MLMMLFLCAAAAAAAEAQAPPTPPQTAAAPGRLRVFLDCDCFETYMRDEILWADFVRQPQDADVHVLSNSTDTGGGGRELVLRFVGIGRFQGVNHELRVITLAAETENVRRAAVLRTMSVGLLQYLAKDGLPPGLNLTVRPAEAQRAAAPPRDPWNLWVFDVGINGSLDAEESNREASWSVNMSADRVTALWKVSFGFDLDEEHETFDLDEEEPFTVRQRERDFDFFLARSLGPHWSFGVEAGAATSTFENTRFSAATGAAVEYSIFPYRDYATKQYVIQYSVGPEHFRYREITLFDKVEETLWRHELSARFDQRQPWGSLEFGIEWSQYLHDLSKYRLEVDGEISWRIARGLEFEVGGSASRIRDQLSLPKRDATPTEVLLRLRELQSGYEYSLSIGISYSFGSLFNNVVNPRFGG